MDEKDIKASEKDSGRLLSNIFDSLRKEIKSISETSRNGELIEHNITLLIEAIRGNNISFEGLNATYLPTSFHDTRMLDRINLNDHQTLVAFEKQYNCSTKFLIYHVPNRIQFSNNLRHLQAP
jgi:hypothetical protein